MLFIHKHGTDYRIKIQGYKHTHLFSWVLHQYEYGTGAKTKKAAMQGRDEILQELEDDRIYSVSWTEGVTYFINGLGFEVNYHRVCARTPNHKGLPQSRRFNYKKYGLRGAFDFVGPTEDQNQTWEVHHEGIEGGSDIGFSEGDIDEGTLDQSLIQRIQDFLFITDHG